ncbi:hypothetical protein EV702DRAFT_1041348 [Suillus placidus]|uniref:Uncharacterized protein n=1 Tax=Suillus placidus TaxID=48579 RepID=A0A9P7A4X5_9AGAM|nr:hypothetical protein EV702DRAFT_1041348 [Suillus placidus]
MAPQLGVVCRAVASGSTTGGVSKAAVAILVVVLILVGLFMTYHWWRPAIPIRSFYMWMLCFVTITKECEHNRHGEECRHGGINNCANITSFPPSDPAAIHRTECNHSWECYSECTVSCWLLETEMEMETVMMLDMASVSISSPSEPAAGSSAPMPAAANGAKTSASQAVPPADCDSFRCPEASEIESASFLEMMDVRKTE